MFSHDLGKEAEQEDFMYLHIYVTTLNHKIQTPSIILKNKIFA